MKTVLVVDDNGMIRRVVAELLQHQGYDVLEAENGHVAQEILAQHRVDLVLTDNDMPLVSGIDLLSHIMTDKQLLNTPVVLMSGKPDVMGLAMKIGATAFVAKPFNNLELIVLVETLLSHEQ